MKKNMYKVILSDGTEILSNSRNARKHLLENDALAVYVYRNNYDMPLLSMAIRMSGCILVGTEYMSLGEH